jgi:hypothetical protein
MGVLLPPIVASMDWYEAESVLNGAVEPDRLALKRPPGFEKVKSPLVADAPPVKAKGEKTTPFTVTGLPPEGATSTAPTNVPLVDTSESPEMFVAAPHVIELAFAKAGIARISAKTPTVARALRVIKPPLTAHLKNDSCRRECGLADFSEGRLSVLLGKTVELC